MRRKIRLRSVLGLYCEKSTPVERFTQLEDAGELRFGRGVRLLPSGWALRT